MADYVDDDGDNYDEEFDFLYRSRANGLGFCGCGTPWVVAERFVKFIESRERGTEEVKSIDSTEDLIIAEVCDNQGLVDHGGSILHCWPTAHGRKWAEAMKRCLESKEL